MQTYKHTMWNLLRRLGYSIVMIRFRSTARLALCSLLSKFVLRSMAFYAFYVMRSVIMAGNGMMGLGLMRMRQ